METWWPWVIGGGGLILVLHELNNLNSRAERIAKAVEEIVGRNRMTDYDRANPGWDDMPG